MLGLDLKISKYVSTDICYSCELVDWAFCSANKNTELIEIRVAGFQRVKRRSALTHRSAYADSSGGAVSLRICRVFFGRDTKHS